MERTGERTEGAPDARSHIGQALLILVVRSPLRPIWRTDLVANRTVIPLVALTLGVLPATVLIEPLAGLLHRAPPPPGLWVPAALLASAATLWTEPLKAVRGIIRRTDR